MHTDYQQYLENVRWAINALIEQLDLVFPGIGLQVYEAGNEKVTLYDRMAFGLYLEFIRMEINPCLPTK